MTSPYRCLALHASLAEPAKLPAEEVVVVKEEEAEDQLPAILLRTIIIIY
jgi:hypothetical protein